VEEGDRLVGLGLFSRRLAGHRRVVPVRRIESLLTGEPADDEIWSEYVGLIAEEGLEEAVGRAVGEAFVRRALGGFDELLCPRVDGSDRATAAMFDHLARWGHPVEMEHRTTCPFAALPGSWDAYLKTRRKAQRYAIRLSLSELEAWAGSREVNLVAATDAASLARGWAIFQQLHGARWAARRPRGLFSSERFARFHEEVHQHLFDRNRLDLLWLEVGGEPVAALYNLREGTRTQVYQSGRIVDDLPSRLSLGTAVHAHAIRRAIDRGDTEYDFLGGATLYKRQFATDQRDLVDRRAWGASPRADAVRGSVSALESLIARMKPLLAGAPAPEEAAPTQPAPPAEPGTSPQSIVPPPR
jgi:hypothetical protein